VVFLTKLTLLVVSAFARDETIINKAQVRQSESDYLVSKSQVEQLLDTFVKFGNVAMTSLKLDEEVLNALPEGAAGENFVYSAKTVNLQPQKRSDITVLKKLKTWQ
jgi:hypothetical protein